MPGKAPEGRPVPNRTKSLQGHQELERHRLLTAVRPGVEDGIILDEPDQLPKAGARGSDFLLESTIVQVAEKPGQPAGSTADSSPGTEIAVG